MIAASSSVVSCNSSLPPLKPNYSLPKSSLSPPNFRVSSPLDSDYSSKLVKISPLILKQEKLRRRSSFNAQSPPESAIVPDKNELLDDGETGGGGGDGGEEERDWTTSFLLFAFWAGLMYYVFFLAPNQTPVDMFEFWNNLFLYGNDKFGFLNWVVIWICAVWIWTGIL